MTKPYLKAPPFHAVTASPSQDQMYVPAWALARVQELLAHVWSSFAQEHDPADGAHRTTKLPLVWAYVDYDTVSSLYSFVQEHGFASIAQDGLAIAVLTPDTDVDPSDYRWVVHVGEHYVAAYRYPTIAVTTDVTVTLKVTSIGNGWSSGEGSDFVLLGFLRKDLT